MQTNIQYQTYFNAERNESILFIAMGLIACSIGVYFLLKSDQAFYKAMSWPLIAVAIIQLVVGSTVLFRTPSDIRKIESYLQEPQQIERIEIPRMQQVMKNFSLYKKIEITLLCIGMGCFIFFPSNEVLKGIGLGLIIQAGVMLLLDFFAEARGRVYLQELIDFVSGQLK